MKIVDLLFYSIYKSTNRFFAVYYSSTILVITFFINLLCIAYFFKIQNYFYNYHIDKVILIALISLVYARYYRLVSAKNIIRDFENENISKNILVLFNLYPYLSFVIYLYTVGASVFLCLFLFVFLLLFEIFTNKKQ